MIDPRTPEETRRDDVTDGAVIDALLAQTPDVTPQANSAANAELRNALLGIRALAHLTAPAPSAELVAQFAANSVAHSAALSVAAGTGSPVVSLSAHRRNRRRTATIIALSMAATIGVGASAAAAVSPEFRAGAGQVLHTITSTIISTVTGNPPATEDAPDSPEPSDTPGQTDPDNRSDPSNNIDPSNPASNIPGRGDVLGTDPRIPNPAELHPSELHAPWLNPSELNPPGLNRSELYPPGLTPSELNRLEGNPPGLTQGITRRD
jgi:hypothetical protein